MSSFKSGDTGAGDAGGGDTGGGDTGGGDTGAWFVGAVVAGGGDAGAGDARVGDIGIGDAGMSLTRGMLETFELSGSSSRLAPSMSLSSGRGVATLVHPGFMP